MAGTRVRDRVSINQSIVDTGENMFYLRTDEYYLWTILWVTPWISLQFSKATFDPEAAAIAFSFSLIDQNGMHCFDGNKGYEYLDFTGCFHKNEDWDIEIWFLNRRFWVIGTDVSKDFLLKQLLEGAKPLTNR
ncbi:MAG TPA: hypothetical protein V6D33_12405 [Cyanophyceae cyanobacterium]